VYFHALQHNLCVPGPCDASACRLCFLTFTSIKMASSTISDFQFFVRRWDLLPDLNGGVGRLIFSRFGHSDLASPDRFWICSHSNGCRVGDYSCNICSNCYILVNGDSYSRSTSNIDQADWLFFHSILILILLDHPVIHYMHPKRTIHANESMHHIVEHWFLKSEEKRQLFGSLLCMHVWALRRLCEEG
jgi:hypothetical protein